MKMQWRLKVMMAERGIDTATELHRRLEAVGVNISSAQLTRVMKEMPARINSELLWGLMKVLDCGPEDLIYVEREDGEPRQPVPPRLASPKKITAPPKKGRRKNVKSSTDDNISSLTGPRAIPFPASLDTDKN